MAEIVLATINATYQHTSFGLRSLKANLGDLREQTQIIEFTLAQKPLDVVETILSAKPKLVGFGVYVWNVNFTLDVVRALKKLAPDIFIVLGGPEISYEFEPQPLLAFCDYVVTGEGEVTFEKLCRLILIDAKPPSLKVWKGELPHLPSLTLPYFLYSDEDLKNRFVYVEASRGCAFKCEFCLSSLDTSVRSFSLETFLSEMDILLSRGAKHFKFVDRTFNLHIQTSKKILEFFLVRLKPDLFLHFELIPDRLPDELRHVLTQFPEGVVQFEIGIQTWNDDVGKRISRKQNYQKVIENLNFILNQTYIHVHADLIVGLPGESLESFGNGFDVLSALRPHEIQVGLLKRLKGTPILRHDEAWGMVYDAAPPFRILATRVLSFEQVQQMERFAKFWDLYFNSGNFKQLMDWFFEFAAVKGSVFWEFFKFSEFLNRRHPQRYAIALVNLVESAWIYFSKESEKKETIRSILIRDYCESPKRDVPAFLKENEELTQNTGVMRKSRALRQHRHLEIN